MKYIKDIREHFKKKPVFSVRDLIIFLSKKKLSKNYAYLLIHNMLKRKEIFRITKGVYSFNDDLMVSGFAFSPFYYGLQEALSLQNLWEQETNPVIITVKKVRPGIRKIFESNTVIKRIDRKMFFGFNLIKYYDFWIPVSSIEKTLIDFAYFKEPLGKETLKEIKKRINKNTLNNYLKKCSPFLRKKIKKTLK